MGPPVPIPSIPITTYFTKYHACIPTIEQPAYLKELAGPWDNSPCSGSSWSDGDCINSFSDLQCATTQGYDDLEACPGSKIEWPDRTTKGDTFDIPDSIDKQVESYRESPTIVIPTDNFKLKCPTCDCQLEREWFVGTILGLIPFLPKRAVGVVPACPFFQAEVGTKMSIEGFKWESELLFDLIDVDANYNLISYTAYDTELKYITLKDKNQVKTTKKCDEDGSKSIKTGKSEKEGSMDDGPVRRRRTTTARTPKGGSTRRHANFERTLAEFYDPPAADANEEEGTCPFFDGDWAEDQFSTQNVTPNPNQSTEGNISDWDIRMMFNDFDTDDDDAITCEDVADYVSCEDFTAYFGKPAEVSFAEFKGFFDEQISL